MSESDRFRLLKYFDAIDLKTSSGKKKNHLLWTQTVQIFPRCHVEVAVMDGINQPVGSEGDNNEAYAPATFNEDFTVRVNEASAIVFQF